MRPKHVIAIAFSILIALNARADLNPSNYLPAARNGDIEAQANAAWAYLSAANPNYAEGVKWLKIASPRSPRARLTLARLYAGKVNPNYNKINGNESIKLLSTVVEDNSLHGTNARIVMADIYLEGKVVPKNIDKAYFWYVAASVSPGGYMPGQGTEAKIQNLIRSLSSKTSGSAAEIYEQAIAWSHSVSPYTRAAETESIRNWVRNGK